ncbi:hypothetical protein ACU4GD_34630 [Cupriavidus basilensis]
MESRAAPRGTGVGRFEIRTPSLVTGARHAFSRWHRGWRQPERRARRASAGTLAPWPAGGGDAGYGVSVSPTGVLARPAALLPAPVLAPLPQPLLASRATVSWSPVAKAAGYRAVVPAMRPRPSCCPPRPSAPSKPRLRTCPKASSPGRNALDATHLGGAGVVMPFAVRLNPPSAFYAGARAQRHCVRRNSHVRLGRGRQRGAIRIRGGGRRDFRQGAMRGAAAPRRRPPGARAGPLVVAGTLA